MKQEARKINNFTDLFAWQEAHELVVLVYKATRDFPKEEVFGLTSQIRRASVSISSNIAEGFGRRSKIDKARFYVMAQGSLSEVQSQLMVARDIDYLEKASFDSLYSQTITVHKLLTGLINKTKES